MTVLASIAAAAPRGAPATMPRGGIAAAGGAAAGPVTPDTVVAAAPASAWVDMPSDRLLVMDLANGGHVVIALSPDFARPHVANIVALARAHWWDGTSINRVQDGYVVQWGDADMARPLPPGIAAPAQDYDRAVAGLRFRAMPYRDAYAARVGHAGGWPVATDAVGAGRAWLPHCYGMVGVARDPAPDTGTGSELYTVIGQAPRQLDRNIAVVGRVLSGMAALTALPRGAGALGVYADPAQRSAILRVRLASDLPAGERPAWQVMATDSPTFAAWLHVKANRRDDFYIRPAGALDICNALPPVRMRPR